MVLGWFFDVVQPHLETLQWVDVIRSFRHGIEDAMSLMGDVPLPSNYHAVLLDLTNTILAAPTREPVRGR